MKYLNLIVGTLFIAILSLLVYKSGISEYVDYKIYDLYTYANKNYSDKKPKSSIVVIDIDEKSLKHLGQWPWSRLLLAKMIGNIAKARPANIGMDIIFPEYDKTSIVQIEKFFKRYFSKNIVFSGIDKSIADSDKIFADSIKSTNVTMSVYMMNDNMDKKCFIPKKNLDKIGNPNTSYISKSMLCNIDILQKSASDIGFINVDVDKDGILRRVPMFIRYKNLYIPSFALSNLIDIDKVIVQKNTITILDHTFKTDNNSDILINFTTKKRYTTISAVDILYGNFDKKQLSGKIVLIGTSAIGLHDHYVISEGKSVPGIFIQASIADSILNNSTRYQPQLYKKIDIFLYFVFSIVLLVLAYRKYFIKAFIFFLSTSILYMLLGYIYLINGIYISVGYFLFPYSVFFVFITIYSIFSYYKDKKRFMEELSKAHSDTIDSMSLVAETRDAETGAHILRTKEYMKYLAEYLFEHDLYRKDFTPNFRKLVYRATPLHDIGKVGIPDSILKKTGSLTKDEYEIMKEHAVIGKQIIENAMRNNKENQFLKIAYNIAYYHHEKWDGSGYPCGLKKEQIPLEARMMALVDVYDALISRRCYKLAFSYEESEKIIIDGGGTHFDPVLVGVFIEIKDKFKEIAEKIK